MPLLLLLSPPHICWLLNSYKKEVSLRPLKQETFTNYFSWGHNFRQKITPLTLPANLAGKCPQADFPGIRTRLFEIKPETSLLKLEKIATKAAYYESYCLAMVLCCLVSKAPLRKAVMTKLFQVIWWTSCRWTCFWFKKACQNSRYDLSDFLSSFLCDFLRF